MCEMKNTHVSETTRVKFLALIKLLALQYNNLKTQGSYLNLKIQRT